MSDILLEAEHLVVETAGGRHLVGPLFFTLEKGQRLGMVGDSGSGKTMTLMALAGLLPQSLRRCGQVKYGGHELGDLSLTARQKQVRSSITMVTQDAVNALNPYQSVRKQLGDTFRMLGVSRAQRPSAIENTLASVDLNADEVGSLYPHQLSGGMRQRVAIAMALSGERDLVLADEPTTSLDVIRQREFCQLLDRYCRERDIAMIFVSHNIALVAQLCDQIAIINQGQIVELADSETLITEPQHPESKRLVSQTLRMQR